MARKPDGYRVVLTADRTLMSEYNGGIFLGFSACVPRGLISDRLYFLLFCPSVETNKQGIVKYAPCGTRKIESALLDDGFKREEIAVVHPDHLDKAVGPRTKVVGITESDPLGMAPATSTFIQLFGGEAYMTIKFKEILNNSSIRAYKPKIVVGGPGAWQLEKAEIRHKLGIDSVVIGEGEKTATSIFKKAMTGEHLPEVVYGEVVDEDEIPLIKGPTMDGLVEIARGCGRGCAFCVPTLLRYRCLPIDHIMKEVKLNLKAGRRPLLHAEDVLRYKAKGIDPNKEAVINLFKTVRNHPGVDSVAISHFALSSVASAPDLVEEVSNILDTGKDGEWFSGQTGIETGSPRLIKDHMLGKCKPFKPEEWPQVVIDAFETLSENSWVPVATLILGLPGENETDIDLTIDLVERLRGFKSLIIPLFLVSEGEFREEAESFSLNKMTCKHSELFLKCWDHSLSWASTFIREYPLAGNIGKGYGAKLVLTYGIGEARRLIRKCQEDYNYDMQRMISDIRSGKTSATPLPIKIIQTLLHPVTR